MKRLVNYINESLFDRDLVTKEIMYHPKTRDELIDCIKEQLEIQGPDANLNIIDTSKIMDMNNLFYKLINGGYKIGNIDISKWNVSHVTRMDYMFFHCADFNCDLSKWDVSNVKYIRDMFAYCSKFNSNLSKWDVSNVYDMSGAFWDCKKFNSDLSKWNVSKAEDMRCMFYGCEKFNCDLSNWDVTNVLLVSQMFDKCKSLKKIPDWYYEKS